MSNTIRERVERAYLIMLTKGNYNLDTISNKEKSIIVNELRTKYPLSIILDVADLKRATFYYHLKHPDMDIKNKEIINQIISIFNHNKKRYGYRRITLLLLIHFSF